jgi:hypothetical protein
VVARRAHLPRREVALVSVAAPVRPPAILTLAQPATPEPPPRPTKRTRHGPHRIEPIAVAPAPRTTAPGALPHKAQATDSRAAPAIAAVAPAKAAAPPTGDDSPAPQPAVAPPTEAEQRLEGEASIDADGVRFVVKAHLPQVHACYARAFKDTSPGGTVEIAFVVNRNGTAGRVHVDSNSTGSDGLARCLEARIAEWQFPRPVGGDFELIYPFVFQPGS